MSTVRGAAYAPRSMAVLEAMKEAFSSFAAEQPDHPAPEIGVGMLLGHYLRASSPDEEAPELADKLAERHPWLPALAEHADSPLVAALVRGALRAYRRTTSSPAAVNVAMERQWATKVLPPTVMHRRPEAHGRQRAPRRRRGGARARAPARCSDPDLARPRPLEEGDRGR